MTAELGLTPEVIAEAVRWRRHLHQHPELAFKEGQTADFIACRLQECGLEVHRGLSGTGVVGSLVRGKRKRSIAIRADMDALPIHERSALSYASRAAGVMHACGHDGHVAMALAAARVCAQMPDLDGTVHFVFQPAEEGAGGARRMVEEGLFRLFPCDSVYALHNWPDIPLGTCVARDRAMMAANAVFEIEITGRGCHGAMPHSGVDPIIVGSQLVSALQSIVSRSVDPLQSAVISVTQIHAGDALNVIPDICVLRGTTRWFDDGVGQVLERRMSELTESLATSFGCRAQFRYERRFPATINDPEAARVVREIASSSPLDFKILDAGPSLASEDFAFMLTATAGCYIWLGSGSPTHAQGLHSSRYDFNDELLPLGAALWIALVRKSLSSDAQLMS